MAVVFSQRRLTILGGIFTCAGFVFYDFASYFFLPSSVLGFAIGVLITGLLLLLASALLWIARASASSLAAIGLVLGLGFVMATLSPTVFAPPGMQGGEAELFRHTPLILAFVGAFMLLAAGFRYMAGRLHNRR